MDLVHAPPNEHTAEELWVWVSVDHKGEGIVAMTPTAAWLAMTGLPGMTLVTITPRLLPNLRVLAQQAAKASGARLRLVRFVRAEIVEEIGG